MSDVAPGSVWSHQNGSQYEVILIANLPDNPRYPQTVVYKTVGTDRVWARPLSDWHRSMTRATSE